MEKNQLMEMIEKVRSENPLIHNITNMVVTNFTANGLLALGASPVMANAAEEAADMAAIADALVLNIGTLTPSQVKAMLLAGRAANQKGIPVLLDPVGAGATAYRTETALMLLKELEISAIRGNAAEIANICGVKQRIKGVDGGGDTDTESLARTASMELGTFVIITGKTDAVSDGKDVRLVHNGSAMLTKVTGAGCLLTAVIGAFMAAEKNPSDAAVSALVFYGICAERAEEKARGKGPGTFQTEFLNELALVTPEDMRTHARLELRKEHA